MSTISLSDEGLKMNATGTYQISKLDRAMAIKISSHTGICEEDILRSILVSKEHVRVIRQRAILAGRLTSGGMPVLSSMLPSTG